VGSHNPEYEEDRGNGQETRPLAVQKGCSPEPLCSNKGEKL